MSERPAVLWSWVRWTAPVGGVDVGTVERLPWAIAAVFVERGEAVEVAEGDVPVAVRRRRGTAA